MLGHSQGIKSTIKAHEKYWQCDTTANWQSDGRRIGKSDFEQAVKRVLSCEQSKYKDLLRAPNRPLAPHFNSSRTTEIRLSMKSNSDQICGQQQLFTSSYKSGLHFIITSHDMLAIILALFQQLCLPCSGNQLPETDTFYA